jgi:hypothetical protein
MLPVCICMAIVVPIRHMFRLTFKLMHICHLTQTSHILPDLVPEFLSPNELFWLFNSSLFKQANDGASSNSVEMGTTTNITSNGEAIKQNIDSSNACSAKNKSTGACLFFIEGYLPITKVKDLINNKIIQVFPSSLLFFRVQNRTKTKIHFKIIEGKLSN